MTIGKDIRELTDKKDRELTDKELDLVAGAGRRTNVRQSQFQAQLAKIEHS